MEFKPYSQDDMAGCIELFDLNCPRFFAREERADYSHFLQLLLDAGSTHTVYLLGWREQRLIACFGMARGVVRNLCAHLDHGSSRISAPRVRRGNDGAAFHAGSGSVLSESGYLYQSACRSVFCPIRGRYPAFAKRRLGAGYASG